MPKDQPTLLSRAMVMRAMGDKQFFSSMPEFGGIQPKLRTMGVDLNSRRGCRGCRQRRVEQNVFRDFLHIVASLPPAGVARLKQYYGVTRLMVTLRDAHTGAFEPRTL